MPEPDSALHVVFGAGQVGSFLAESLLASGFRVRVAKRSPSGIPDGAEPALGDATDPDVCREVTRGAEVVYHCMNPPYDADVWEDVLPRFLENLVAGAGEAGARLVVLENLYMLGTGGGRPMDEDTPFHPQSRKGEIRARMAEALLAAHERGVVQAVSGRASDFYGPRGEGTHFGEPFWTPVLEGKTVRFLADPDTLHTYHYIPDVAEGLKTLGLAEDDVVGRPWMLPCAPAETTRDLVERFARALGRPIRLGRLPWAARKAAGLFIPIVREIDEMLHQWDGPFVVDDGRWRERFALRPTDPDTGAEATVAWARERYGGAA